MCLHTHTSNGADYPYTMTLITTQEDACLGAIPGNRMTLALNRRMQARGWPMVPYVYSKGQTPDKGIVGFETPRYSTGYASLWGTLGFTTEAHMLKPFADRVQATLAFWRSWLRGCRLRQLTSRLFGWPSVWCRGTGAARAMGAVRDAGRQHRVLGIRGWEVVESRDRWHPLRYNRDSVWTQPFHLTTGTRPWSNQACPSNGCASGMASSASAFGFERGRQDSSGVGHGGVGERDHRRVVPIGGQALRRTPPADGGFSVLDHVAGSIVRGRLDDPSIKKRSATWWRSSTPWRTMRCLCGTSSTRPCNGKYYSGYVFEDTAEDMLMQIQPCVRVWRRRNAHPEWTENPGLALRWLYEESPHNEGTVNRYPVLKLN